MAKAARRELLGFLPPLVFVYFVQAGTDGPVKIGTATDIQARVRGLQTGSPHRLNLLATSTGGRRLEKRLHRRFAAHRVLGEWFSPAPALLEYIASLR